MAITRWEMRQCPNPDCGMIWPTMVRTCPLCAYRLQGSEVFDVIRAKGARRGHPDTSRESYSKLESDLPARQATVLAAVREFGRTTGRQATERTGIRDAWKRLSELEAKGFIASVGTEFDPITNRNVSVWDNPENGTEPEDDDDQQTLGF